MNGNTPSTRRSGGSHSGLWDGVAGIHCVRAPRTLTTWCGRKVAEAMRDMVRSHAENGNGALSRLLHTETQEDSRSSLPGAAMEPGADAVDDVGVDMEIRGGGRQVLKRWMMW